MNDRLLALATEMAKRNHNGIYPGHDEDDFATCPHPDCAAVRAGAALPPQPEAQDVIDACANYLERNYPEEGAEYVEALRHQAWGPILPALPLLGAWRDRERNEQ